MKQIITTILIAIAFISINCGNTKEVIEIKPKVIHPPVIEDTVTTALKDDSVIIAVKTKRSSMQVTSSAAEGIQQIDTTIIIKYFPRYQKFYVKVKPDSIIVFDTVKTVQTIEKNVETPFLSKIGLVMIGIIISIAVIYILKQRG